MEHMETRTLEIIWNQKYLWFNCNLGESEIKFDELSAWAARCVKGCLVDVMANLVIM